ncbi:alpha/beta-hydrolase [Corynespora cassiicola Philippines]|uniref:Alpha/beta-hydrolase n=1 Tax=Corynespora cassiicola Philippines TaxID=1448308 RepID=A0A2T2N2A1_CORCC|nr:alpha/beta-hydrolase [Corynespora cassiicola Philippines]
MADEQQAEKVLQEMTANLVEKLKLVLFAPVTMRQMVTAEDTPATGSIWVSRSTFKKPDDCEELTSVLRKIFAELSPSKQSVVDFSIEHVKEKEQEPTVSEQEKYDRALKDVTADIVILYAHGGFYYTGSPASVRSLTLALAKATGGRFIVLEYRFAPQNVFPAAVIGLLLTYMSLLSPSEDAGYISVSAKNIVFAGDSSGGNLVLSLLALLQYIRDCHNGCVHFRGKWVDIPLSAGAATMSAHCDHALSFDFQARNKPYDIFVLEFLPYLQPSYPACDLWPTNPPRGDIYCDGPTLLHPLVSVAIAASWSAKDMPSIFMVTGQERLTDGQYYLAKKAEKSATTVRFLQYNALPHTFASFFPRLPHSKHLIHHWWSFCRDVVHNSSAVKRK